MDNRPIWMPDTSVTALNTTHGATIHQLDVSVSDSLAIHGSLKFRYNGTGRLLAEGFSGDDLYRGTGRWMTKSRLLDHPANQYREVVTDPVTGGDVHRCEEPLTAHLGHGSDRKKRRPVRCPT